MAEPILIVDDDPVQRRLLEGMARRFGYDVDDRRGRRCGGRDARRTATAARIDCVMLDLVMPDLDGYGVLARMRDAGLSIPVIVQTAHGGIDTVVSAMRAGAMRFRREAGRRRAPAGVAAQRAVRRARSKPNSSA